MASLLEMRFASEGEEDDTDYEESSSSERGTHSGSSSSSSSDEEGELEQQRQRVRGRSYRSGQSTQRAAETASTAADATAPLGDAAASFSCGRLAVPPGASVAAAPAALWDAGGTAREDPTLQDAAAVATAATAAAATAAAATAAAATAAASGVLTGAEEGREQEEGELQLHGRKKIFSARQRNAEDRKHARAREQASSQHRKRHAERLKACEVFKEMQEADKQALRNYPSTVDPDDFLLQFHRRCPPESSASTKSWQHLQHYLAIAVSALRQPGPSAAAGSAPQQLQPRSISPSPVAPGDAASAASPASLAAAAPGLPSVKCAAETLTAQGHASPAAAVLSPPQEQQQHAPAAPSSSSLQRPCSAASAAGTLLPLPAVLQEHKPGADATDATTAAGRDRGDAAAPSSQMQEGKIRGPRMSPAASGGDACDEAAASGAPAAGGAAAGAAAGGARGMQQQQQETSYTGASAGDAPLGAAADDAAAAAVGPSAAAPTSMEVLESSPAVAGSGFSIRECKERCRKKLSNATLNKMMQEALHNMENSGEVSVKKVVRFAGQIIEVEERIEAASARYQQMLELRRRVPQHIGGRFAGLDGLVASLDDPSSINSVQKSQADWELYKREKGLAAELAKGHGFLQKQAFLAQTEWKQHEQNVELRRKRQAEHR